MSHKETARHHHRTRQVHGPRADDAMLGSNLERMSDLNEPLGDGHFISVFNEGYPATSGTPVTRVLLCVEAIRLDTVLIAMLPDEPEALNWLELMELQASCSAARVGPDGEIVLIADQDCARWTAE